MCERKSLMGQGPGRHTVRAELKVKEDFKKTRLNGRIAEKGPRTLGEPVNTDINGRLGRVRTVGCSHDA